MKYKLKDTSERTKIECAEPVSAQTNPQPRWRQAVSRSVRRCHHSSRWRQAVSPKPQVEAKGRSRVEASDLIIAHPLSGRSATKESQGFAARFGFPEHADSTARVPRKRRTAARGPRCTWLAVDASTAAWAASTQDTRDGRHQARMTDNAACPSSRSAVSSLASVGAARSMVLLLWRRVRASLRGHSARDNLLVCSFVNALPCVFSVLELHSAVNEVMSESQDGALDVGLAVGRARNTDVSRARVRQQQPHHPLYLDLKFNYMK